MMGKKAWGLALAMQLTLSAVPRPAQGAAWMQPEGNYYAKVWLSLLRGARGALNDGEAVKLSRSFTDIDLQIYAEEGISDRFTMVYFGSLWGWSAVGDDSTMVLGPLNIGGRLGLVDSPGLQLSAEAHYGYAPPVGDQPLLTDTTPAGRGFFYQPIVSTHRFDAQVQAGRGLPWGWVEAIVGLRAHTAAELGSAAYGSAQVGYSAFSDWTLDLHFTAYRPFSELNDSNISGAGNTRYLGWGIGAAYALTDHWGIVVGMDSAFIVRSNALAPVWILGMERRGG